MESSQASNGDADLMLVNRLEGSKSPYVRAHRHNPVAWQMFDMDALSLAKKLNRLLFVSIGYASCHWCHVMERESFMSPEVATLLNSSFVPVKVDREERPDVDAIYMNYVQAMTGSGGWPLNVFLTPDLQPVFGGTYFSGPNSLVPGLGTDAVGFVEILEKMKEVWTTQEQKCRDSAKEITKQLKEFAEEGVHSQGGTSATLDLELLEEAYRTITHSYDQSNGGFSLAPKFPVPVKLRFLLQLGEWPSPVKDFVGVSSCVNASNMALTTLSKMARGGIRDHIGSGFARYSVTKDWSLPHFEKMLSDQALLLDVYLDAFLLSRDAEALGAVYDLATYLTSPTLLREGGGFFASEDADSAPSRVDSEKREGAFYVWTYKTLLSLLGAQKIDVVARFFGVEPDGNVPREHDPHDDFLDQNVLSVVSTPQKLSKELGIPEAEVAKTLHEACKIMREYRERERPRPTLDDKIVVAWNGLAIAALARASTALHTADPENSRAWLDAAKSAADFVRKEMWDSKTGVLWRVWRNGRGRPRGLADDYASLTYGALELYSATFDTAWLQWADELMAAQIKYFWADSGGFYTAPREPDSGDHGDLLLRLKTGMDSAEPSANSLSASNLCRLASLLDDARLEGYARQTVSAFEAEIDQWPGSFPGLLGSVAWLGVDTKSILIVGPDHGGKESMRLEDVLAKIRSQLGVGRTVLRIRGSEDEAWLRRRNGFVGSLDTGQDTLRIMYCPRRRCVEVHSLTDL